MLQFLDSAGDTLSDFLQSVADHIPEAISFWVVNLTCIWSIFKYKDQFGGWGLMLGVLAWFWAMYRWFRASARRSRQDPV